MNKLKLNPRNVGEILSREQMKNIAGGAGHCAIYFSRDSNNENWTNTGEWGYEDAEYVDIQPSQGSIYVKGISLAEVENALENTTGGSRQWCCDSCGSASWYY